MHLQISKQNFKVEVWQIGCILTRRILCGLLHDAVYISDHASVLQRIWKEMGNQDSVICIAPRLWERRSGFRNPSEARYLSLLHNASPAL